MPVRHIVFAVAPDLVLLDACGPLEAFWRAELTMVAAAAGSAASGAAGGSVGVGEVDNPGGSSGSSGASGSSEASSSAGKPREPIAYRTTVASIDGGVLQTFPGLPVVTERLDSLDDQSIDTLIVPGVPIDEHCTLQPELVAWIRRRAPQARRVCSVCTGAFYLAAAGLLDGRRATTHWRDAPLLARRFPNVQVDADPIFIRDVSRGEEGRVVWTSAGVTAGIDLALALIEEDVGHAVAMQAARRLVVFMKRPGGQSQFSAALAAQASAGGPFEALHSWMASHLRDDLSVERLAERAQMSPRTFARRYVDEVGRTPAKTVSALRLEAAARALAESYRPLKRIALDCGFGSEQNLRRAFVRRFGVLPLEYRERFESAVVPRRAAASAAVEAS
ncbi:GlxA family transcriptional regulator [Paraburkholderia domus]|uniref:GlxA family transcriptional regulator n=1 Tax=Paraburkholderia domus TaxID=2793075 RepID=UPI001912CC56|nr:AraC family transcriptional regulator [Paraburkholderia domus]MBK5058990.1 AraC family transcriptional regulator [Burkholderia sp. R-70199]MBK5119022.1 AraC family transcriptional regulator [Burkholderia sp. R-69980]MBK5184759.1 AraC family transcriptional regulator [Burkholderia sp. R-69749]MCI0145142.1 helix-turn-helix domain-containing protein [Paraburkholderia sediminicola]CAE6866996.1 HTH-type transcriptional activator RhaS [Paraburkholderia domus]